MVRVHRFGRRAAALVLAAALTLQATPTTALAEAAAGRAAASSGALGLAEGSYVEGEAIVLYHAEPAEQAAAQAASLVSEDEGGATALLSEGAAEVPGTGAFALEGFSVTDAWDVSAPDNGAALASSDGDAAADEAPEAEACAEDADLRIAQVSKDGASTEEMIEQLEALDYVVSAEPNQVCMIDSGVPNDTYYESWQSAALTDDSSSIGLDSAVAADDGWSTAATGDGENIVAVIDTGVDFSNPDLANMAWQNPGNIGLEGEHGYDFGMGDDDPTPEQGGVVDSHGTHCAGAIAAQANNGQGVVGSAQATRIMALKTTTAGGEGSLQSSAVIASYGYVVAALAAGQNVVAINNSWHGGAYSRIIDYLVNQAGKLGALSFFAAGNAGLDVGSGTESAAAYGMTAGLESPYAVVVASSNQDNQLSTFSNYDATQVDVAAPGSLILSTVANNDVTSGSYWSALLSKQRLGADALTFYDDFSTFGSSDAGYVWRLVVPYSTESGMEQLTIESETALRCGLASLTNEGVALCGEPALKVTLDGDKLQTYMRENSGDASWSVDSWLSQTNLVIRRTIDNPFKGKGLNSLSDYRLSSTVAISDASTSTYAYATNIVIAGDTAEDMQPIASGSSYMISIYDNLQMNSKFDDLSEEAAAALDVQDKLTLCVQLLFGSSTTGAASAADGSHKLTGTLTAFGFGHKDTYQPYGIMSGTSMATPTLVGAYAELVALYPNETALELRGRVVGSTEATKTASYSEGRETATNGRFSFDAGALDSTGAGISANTWSAEADAGAGIVTLYGRGLGDASVAGDDGAALAVDSRAEDGSWVKLKVDSALFDGAFHRFDVTDGSTGKTHKASYEMPSAASQEVGSELAKVIDLPAATAGDGNGCVVSTPVGMAYLAGDGSYAYLCADPSAEAATWQELAAPGVPWKAQSADNPQRELLSFGYAEGTLYAVCSESDGSGGVAVWASTYDLSAGTGGSWSAYKQIASRALPTYEDSTVSLESSSLHIAAADGTVYCSLFLTESVTSAQGSETTTSNVLLMSAEAGTCDFTQKEFSQNDDMGECQVIGYVGGSSLKAIGYVPETKDSAAESGANRFVALAYDADAGAWTKAEVAESPSLTDSAAADLVGSAFGAVGNGAVMSGKRLGGYGDLVLFDPETATMESLGSYGLLTSEGYVVKSLQMLGGVLYVHALDARTAANGGDGSSLGALYALPASAQAKVTSTDASMEARAGEGGSASVADWRGGVASSVAVRVGDRATWTAAAAEGYTFAGWYGEDGSLVSSDASYTQVASASMSLTARFTKNASPTPGGGSGGGSSGGSSGADSDNGSSGGSSAASGAKQASARGRSLPRGGDETNYAVPIVMALLGVALVVAAVAVRRGRK